MKTFQTVCSNPWCKATFTFTEEDLIVVNKDKRTNSSEEEEKIEPKICKKCQSFDKDLSGGIEWKDKEYEGDRFDGLPHSIRYKVTNYRM